MYRMPRMPGASVKCMGRLECSNAVRSYLDVHTLVSFEQG